MIACISPSIEYSEETWSTLTYASRTMNIKNIPIIQMDIKDQLIYQLQHEIENIYDENEKLKLEYYLKNSETQKDDNLFSFSSSHKNEKSQNENNLINSNNYNFEFQNGY